MSRIANFWKDQNLTNKEVNKKCCGCSACESLCPKNAIKMEYDAEGFLYPKIDNDKCVNCSICLKTCPVENAESKYESYYSCYAAFSKSQEVLKNTTSGGFATTVSNYFIENGDVVFGVKYSNDFVKSVYALAENKDELKDFANSKYIQSEKNGIYRLIREKLICGKKVLFVGCPCDVAGLHFFLNREYDNLTTIELVCMGVTSYKVAEEYKKLSEKKNKSKLVYINARSKKRGWFVPSLEERFENGKTTISTLFSTYYGYGFQIYNRPSCFDCKYRGENGYGDFRIGDFWGIDVKSEYFNKDGVSCVMVRNEKADKLLHEIKDLKIFPVKYEEIIRDNPSAHRNKSEELFNKREKFSNVFNDRGLIVACKKTSSMRFKLKRIIPQNLHVGLKKIYHKIFSKQ